MENLGRVKVFHSDYYLIHEPPDMLPQKCLLRFNNIEKIAFHELRNKINLVKSLPIWGNYDIQKPDQVFFLLEKSEEFDLTQDLFWVWDIIFEYLSDLKELKINRIVFFTFLIATLWLVILSVAEKTIPKAPIPIILWILYLASISVLLSDIRNLIRFRFPGFDAYPYLNNEFISR